MPATPIFDPTSAVRFDLSRGSAQDSGGGRLCLVPAAALSALTSAAGSSASTLFGRSVGEACGARVASRLGGNGGVGSARTEDVVTNIAGELSMAGFGLFSLERWGRALVVRLENTAVEDDVFLSAVVEGALAAATSRGVSCALLMREGSTVRLLVGNDATASKTRDLVANGVAWGEILSRLQTQGGT